MVEVIPGLSQNILNHSFMSASLFNETQRRFFMRKHFCAAGKSRYAGISRKSKERRKASSELRRKNIVVMVTVWVCCHQASKNRADRFLYEKTKK